MNKGTGAQEGSMLKELYRMRIKPKREGWVYLIYAQGTRRLKIGRSQYPVTRHSVLQKPSPFPLTSWKCFHSKDAITDEAKIHEELARFRVHGEWFEFKSGEDVDLPPRLDRRPPALRKGPRMAWTPWTPLRTVVSWLALSPPARRPPVGRLAARAVRLPSWY